MKSNSQHMEINSYREVDIKSAKDFRDLSEQERKEVVQRFIDQIIYDAERFQVAVRILEKWEAESESINNQKEKENGQ